MPRTIISLSETETAWLTRQAETEHVPMTEIVRRALQLYRRQTEQPPQPGFEELLEKTRGIWFRRGRARLPNPNSQRMGSGPMTYLLDSVILIDHFNGVEAATRYLKENAREIAISVITRAEVRTGFSLERESLAKALLDRIPHYPVTKDEADLAAGLRWKLPDALQAAVALHHRLKLVTRNTKDFNPAQHPFVVVPYTGDRSSS